MIKEITRNAIKFIVLILAFIYIVIPIDLLPFNPLDDIIVGAIAFFITFSDNNSDSIIDKLSYARNKKNEIKRIR